MFPKNKKKNKVYKSYSLFFVFSNYFLLLFYEKKLQTKSCEKTFVLRYEDIFTTLHVLKHCPDYHFLPSTIPLKYMYKLFFLLYLLVQIVSTTYVTN